MDQYVGWSSNFKFQEIWRCLTCRRCGLWTTSFKINYIYLESKIRMNIFYRFIIKSFLQRWLSIFKS
ncbi:hypothetical protein ZOSMA_3G01330 [Zostera marina]|uniref:Uncharacterized protein n=1 Tax=Zostera marina TaxID=29655 RepID=A0A0K9P3P9_ZOSMR|nr:hypothetical protein ZOSMA_3G01330 [Zostera marina]